MTAIIREEPVSGGAVEPARAGARCDGSWSAASPRTRRTGSARPRTWRATSRTCATTSPRRRVLDDHGSSGRGREGGARGPAGLAVAPRRARRPGGRRRRRARSRPAGRRESTPPPSFRQLTFQRGEIYSARFAPDGQTIVYAASWEGRPVEIFVSRLDSPEARPFGLKAADLLADLSLGRDGGLAEPPLRRSIPALRHTGPHRCHGRRHVRARSRKTCSGRTGRPTANRWRWSGPSGPRCRLEFPIGKVLFETDGWITNPRVSPDGDRVAFLHHPVVWRTTAGSVDVVDRAGSHRKLAGDFSTEGGLAWSPGGKEVWFSAAETGGNRALYAVSLSGEKRGSWPA